MRIITRPTARISRATVEATWKQRAPDQRLIVRDKDCRGLALVVNPTTMRWEFSYRPRGTDPRTGRRWPNKALTIGNPATHSPEDARHEANRIKGQAAAGADPAAEKKAKADAERKARADAERKSATTLRRLADEYAAALPRRPKFRGAGLPSSDYVAQELSQLRLALADMDAESTLAADVTVADIRGLLSGARGVTTARKRFGTLSRFMDWCMDENHTLTNPCAGIARQHRPRPPQARSHYLAPAELARLWKAADNLREPVWRDLARFLIAVPCRRNEAARLDWSHVDPGTAEWRQPSHLTKNRDPHRLHLHPLALAVLREREENTNGKGMVFPAPVSGGMVDTFTDIKAALVKAAGLDGWTWHDFRRSFATALGEASIPEAVADAVLNHRQSATRGGVLGAYQRASRWPEQIRAMQLWGRLLQAALDGREAGANVMAMPARTA